MSAGAALQKWLELKNRSSIPIFSDNILGEPKTDNSTEKGYERIMDFLFFSLFYLSVRVLVFLSNWYSRYQYFKTKKPGCSTTHALYYSWFYCTASGEYKIIRLSYHSVILILRW